MPHRTILFVDDEPHVTAALKRRLRREPYEVLGAGSGREALGILARAPVDVVISDEDMPGMSGSEFLARVCAEHPRTIRMMLTGHASLETALRAINAGHVYRFFTKPCPETELIVALRQALQLRDLAQQSRLLLSELKRRSAILAELEREQPGITEVETDATGAILIDDDGDIDRLIDAMGRAAGGRPTT